MRYFLAVYIATGLVASPIFALGLWAGHLEPLLAYVVAGLIGAGFITLGAIAARRFR